MSTDDRSPNEGQLSKGLPGVTTHWTGHDDSTGKAIVQESRPASWTVYDGDEMAFSVAYTTSSFPASVNQDADIKAHNDLMSSKKLGLVNPTGTVCRIVDFAPGYQCVMHRTQSLDYGIILEGTISMVLDDGSETPMRRGDVAVQRATMHAWRNTSKTDWARMIFVLQACQKVTIAGEDVGEAGVEIEGLPASQTG